MWERLLVVVSYQEIRMPQTKTASVFPITCRMRSFTILLLLTLPDSISIPPLVMGAQLHPQRLTHYSTSSPWDFLTTCLENIPCSWLISGLYNLHPSLVILSYPKLMSHLLTIKVLAVYTICWLIFSFKHFEDISLLSSRFHCFSLEVSYKFMA